MSVTPACRLPTSIDKRRQLVVVVVVVTPKSILIVTCTFLGDPLWHHAICIYNWISSVIFVNSPWKFKKSKKYFLLQFFIGEADNCKNEIQTSKRFFWPEKWFLKKVTHFPFFCTNHSSGLLCSCKRFCVVDFWPLFRFSASQKLLLSLLQE